MKALAQVDRVRQGQPFDAHAGKAVGDLTNEADLRANPGCLDQRRGPIGLMNVGRRLATADICGRGRQPGGG
jgi:hypothetical protein